MLAGTTAKSDTFAEAREKALANRTLARSGGEPLSEKCRLRSMPTFAAAEAVCTQMPPAGATQSTVRAGCPA